jgi:hypothetical protein
MALARRNSRGGRAASIPLVCDVCRERPATTQVAGFIFACDVCAERISTGLWRGREAEITRHKKSEKDDSPRINEKARRYLRDFEHVAEMTTEREVYDKMLSAHMVKA